MTDSPWWGRGGVPHPPTSQSGMAGTRASFIPSLKKTVVTAATVCRHQAFCGHHRCQADGPFTSPLTRGHLGTAHSHSRGQVSLCTQASSSRTFCACNALRDTWSEAHTHVLPLAHLHLFSAQCSGGGPQGFRGLAEASLTWLITQLEAQPRVERQLRECSVGT